MHVIVRTRAGSKLMRLPTDPPDTCMRASGQEQME